MNVEAARYIDGLQYKVLPIFWRILRDSQIYFSANACNDRGGATVLLRPCYFLCRRFMLHTIGDNLMKLRDNAKIYWFEWYPNQQDCFKNLGPYGIRLFLEFFCLTKRKVDFSA